MSFGLVSLKQVLTTFNSENYKICKGKRAKTELSMRVIHKNIVYVSYISRKLRNDLPGNVILSKYANTKLKICIENKNIS